MRSEPEYPVPEGTSCSLSVAAHGAPPFFTISNAKRERADAVSALLAVL